MMVVSSKSLRHKMWTEITRCKYEREGQRYASDVTDAEWALIEPHMPAVKRLGLPRETELRAVLDAILYIARTGCQWRMPIEIVKRAADAAGFVLLPRRWVVERTLAWLNRNRRLAKDFEATIASAKAWVYIASVLLLVRRLA